MRSALVSLAAVLCLLMALPASAGILYDNGPVNGTIDAYTINFGFQVADSFTLSSGSTVTGANLYVWLGTAGDNFTEVDWSILDGTGNVLGATLASGTAAVISTKDLARSPNPYGYDIDSSTFSILPNQSLGAGTYFLMLQNAVALSGGPVIGTRTTARLSRGRTPSDTSAWALQPVA